MLESLEAERAELLQRLEKATKLPDKQEIKRQLWVVNGTLKKGLDPEILLAAVAKHKEQG